MDSFEHLAHAVPAFPVDWQIIHSAVEHLTLDELVPERLCDEVPIPLSPGDAFRKHQIMWLEAQCDGAPP